MAVMACCALGGSAQSTFKLKDLKRQQEALAAAAAVGASSGAEMQAIKPELSVVRQQYRLERNGEYFGKTISPSMGRAIRWPLRFRAERFSLRRGHSLGERP